MQTLTSTVANSAKPNLQLSLLRRSLTSRTRRRVPSLAPRLASPVVEATLALFLGFDVCGLTKVDDGLNNFATPFAKSSSVTLDSNPRRRRNCEGALSGDASLSPVLTTLGWDWTSEPKSSCVSSGPGIALYEPTCTKSRTSEASVAGRIIRDITLLMGQRRPNKITDNVQSCRSNRPLH